MIKAIIGCWLGLLAVTVAAGQDEDFITARNAFQANDRARLARVASGLQGYVLEPYVAYWQLKLDLDNASPEDVQAFLAKYGDSVVGERMRADYLKILATRGDWAQFKVLFPLVPSPDPETLCFAAQAGMRQGDLSGMAAVRPLWASGRELPAACTPVFEAMLAGGQLTTQDVWARMRLALEAGQVGLAKKLAGYLPPRTRPTRRCWMPPPTIRVASSNSGRGVRTIAPGARSRCSRCTGSRGCRRSRRGNSG